MFHQGPMYHFEMRGQMMVEVLRRMERWVQEHSRVHEQALA